MSGRLYFATADSSFLFGAEDVQWPTAGVGKASKTASASACLREVGLTLNRSAHHWLLLMTPLTPVGHHKCSQIWGPLSTWKSIVLHVKEA